MAYSAAGSRATSRYRSSHYESVSVQAAAGFRERWKSAARSAGQSLNAYVMQAVEERIARESAGITPTPSTDNADNNTPA